MKGKIKIEERTTLNFKAYLSVDSKGGLPSFRRNYSANSIFFAFRRDLPNVRFRIPEFLLCWAKGRCFL